MKRKKSIVFLIIILHVIGIGFVKRLFLSKKLTDKVVLAQKRSPEKTTVKSDRVKREDLDFVFSYVGNIKAKDEVFVFSKVSGKLSGYAAVEGEPVEKGQLIALVDRDETGLKYELAKVESPIAGRVGMTLLDKGADVLAANTAKPTPLAIVVHMDEMIVKLAIREQDIPFITKGFKASLLVDAYPNEKLSGEISKVSEVVDIVTRTLPIEIVIPNPQHRLKSGMFARIRIFAGKHAHALVIPADALVKEDNSDFVYVAEDSIAKKVRVRIGIRQDNKIEILEGLEENQKILVFGHQWLKDGASINIIDLNEEMICLENRPFPQP